jgi:hypothetical protein
VPIPGAAFVITLVIVIVAIPVLAVGLAFADRAAAGAAERRASDYLATPFGQPATVRVHGTPFLTQALRGCYRHLEVAGTVRVGGITGAVLDAHLHQVHLPLGPLLRRRTTEVACDRVDGELLLPYPELARLSRIPGLELTYERDRLVASAPVSIPGMSGLPGIRDLPGMSGLPGLSLGSRLSGEAVLSVNANGVVWLRLRALGVAGVPLPSGILAQLLPNLNVPITLPALPYGLRLEQLRPTTGGLVARCAAEHVVFRAAARA